VLTAYAYMWLNVAPTRLVGSVGRRNSDGSKRKQNSTLVPSAYLDCLLSAPFQRTWGPTRRKSVPANVCTEGAVQEAGRQVVCYFTCGGISPQFRLGKANGGLS
jgi:hypothetical protein